MADIQYYKKWREKMKAAVYEGSQKISIKNVEMPVLESDEALVQVKYCGICGSDLFICSGKHPRVKPPLIFGHEFSGVIIKINEQNLKTELKIGDRVAVRPTYPCGQCDACREGAFHICGKLALIGIDSNGGFAEYVKVPLSNIVKVSKQVAFEEIALVEPLAVAVHAVRSSRMKVGDRVIVLGGGPIGLLIASLLKLAGATQIIISEVNPYQLDKANSLGFITINPLVEDIIKRVDNLTNGKGADLLFDAAGVPSTAEQSTKLVKVQGEIVIVGVFEEPAEFDFLSFMNKEQKAVGIRVYSAGDVKKAVELLEAKLIDVRPLISHKLKLDDIEKGFKLIKNNAETMKIMIYPE